jgi:hypothetical protein
LQTGGTACFAGQTHHITVTCFKVDEKFFQTKDVVAMGNSLSPIVSNIYMDYFEKLAFDSAQHVSSLCLHYVDATFMVLPKRPEQLENFLIRLGSLKPSILSLRK